MPENNSLYEPDPDLARERTLDDHIDADAIGTQVLADALIFDPIPFFEVHGRNVTVTVTPEARRQTRLDPASPSYCAACTHDMHNCRGCGDRVTHGRHACDGCQADPWPIGRD